MKIISTIVTGLLLTAFAWGAEVKVKMADLPAAVQAAVKAQTADAKLVGLSKETEHGQTIWEAETTLNGKGRDVSFDKTGAIVSVEQEVELDSLPAAAKSAIQKKVGKGTLKKVETITEGKAVSYEATIALNGKMTEVGVNADGSPHKED